MKPFSSILALAWAGLVVPYVAHAQDTVSKGESSDPASTVLQTEASSAPHSNDGLTDIVVTAQRRAQRLSDVPIAVSAFSAETLTESRIATVNDIASRTPNFTETSASPGDPHLFIRGIGSSDDSAAGDRSVGVFVDDVYIGRGGAMVSDFFDVAQVEVLRGPQGTLYGRNVVGGSVNITTAPPEDGFHYGGELTGGNYHLFEAKALLNAPLGQTTALRIAATHSEHEGYSRNIFTGQRVDASNVDAVRGALRVAPSDDLEITLRANYGNNSDFGQARKADPCGPVNCGQRFNNSTIGNVSFDPDPRHVQSQRNGYFLRDQWGTSAAINWTTGIGVVSSITAYLHNKWDWLDELSGLPDVLRIQSTNYVSESAGQFSQELRLSSLPGERSLSWSAGVYYYVENVDRDEVSDRCISNTGLTACARTYIDYAQNVKSQSVAGYAEIQYKPLPALSVTVGARYTHDHKEATLAGINLGPAIPASSSRQPWTPFDVADSWNAFTPRAVIQYNFTRNAMAYATISRGYKAGGYQGQADNGLSASVPFQPEHVTNYEVGTKLGLFNRRVQFNAAAFVMKYTDLQVRTRVQLDPNNVGSIINVTSNAADATIKGLEGELTVRPVRQLELWASGSLLDATYDSFNNGSTDYSGQRLPRTPKHAFTLGGELTLPLGNVGEVALRGEAQYKGKLFFDNDNTIVPGIEPARTIYDASIRFSPEGLPFSVQLWGKNLSNKLVRENVIIVGDSGFSRYNAPRTFGVTLRFHD